MEIYLSRFIADPETILNASIDLQLAIANYIDTPRQLLELLVNSLDRDVAAAARLHVNWNGEIGTDSAREIDNLLATQQLGQNDRLAVELLKLGTVPPCFISEWVPPDRIVERLDRPDMPLEFKIEFLERLARENRLDIVVPVAGSIDTPPQLLAQLIGSVHLAIRDTARNNPSCPPAIIDEIDRDYKLAANWETDPARLAILAMSHWEWIRSIVAGNPAANAATLMELAEDELWRIKLTVAKNPHAPAEVLQVLANSDLDPIRNVVASNSNTSEETLNLLFPFCKRILWNRQDLPLSILERLFADRGSVPIWKDSETRNCLLRAVNTSPELLDQLAIDCHQEVSAYHEGIQQAYHSQEVVEGWIIDATNYLGSIVEHPNISLDTLMRLCTYPNPNVRLAVGLNAKTPEETRITLVRNAIDNYYKIHDIDSIRDLAYNGNVPLTILEELANSFFTHELVLRRFKLYISCFSDSLFYRLLEFVECRGGTIQILLSMQESTENQDRSIAEWEELLDSLSEIELDCVQKIYRLHIPESKWIHSYYDTAAKWTVKGEKKENGKIVFMFPSGFYFYILLIHLREIDADSSAANLGKEDIIVAALIENPRISHTLRSRLWQKYYRDYMDDRDGYYSSRKAEAVFKQKFFLALGDSMAEQEDNIREIIKYGCYNKTIARHPQTLPNILRELIAQDRSYAQLIAQNPNAPRDMLLELSKDSNLTTRNWVAENPNTPLDILLTLTNNNALKNPNFPPLERYRVTLEHNLSYERQAASELIASLPLKTKLSLTQVVEGNELSAKLSIAGDLQTPIAILERLAEDANEDVRSAVASNRNLPLATLFKLTDDPSSKVRSQLVVFQHNRTTPVEILAKLANDPDSNIRMHIARNANTPPEILAQLAFTEDLGNWIAGGLIDNQNTPVETLEYLGVVRHKVNAYNKKTPPNALAAQVDYALTLHQKAKSDIFEFLLRDLDGSQMPASSLAKLATNSEVWIRSRVASHRNTPVDILEQLSNDKSYDPILWGLARNPNSPPRLLEKLMQEDYVNIAGYIVERAIIPPTVMDRLLEHESEHVRVRVVCRDNLPLDLASRIINTETHDSVLLALARNPILTSELISEFIQHYGTKVDVCIALLGQPNLTIEHWRILVNNPSETVRLAIASRQNAPIDILTILANDRQLKIRMAIAGNPQTSSDILIKLATDLEPEVRTKIAANLQTPISILETLATDASVEVRRSVFNHPQTPELIRQDLEDIFGRKPIATTIDTLRDLPRIYDPANDDLITILTEYARSNNAFVRLVSLLHPLVPSEIIERASRSVFWSDRYAVAKNPITPDSIRQKLILDSNRIVSAIASMAT